MNVLRWLEAFFLRIIYFFLRLLTAQQKAIGALRKRALMFITLVLGVIAVVFTAAIPVSHYLLGEELQAVAAVEPQTALSGTIEKTFNVTSLIESVENVFSDLIENRTDAQVNNFTQETIPTEVTDEQFTPSVVAARETALEHASKHADPLYVCPMHPQITSKNANETCPICGMQLVALKSDNGPNNSGQESVVTISPAVMNNLGVRTASVTNRTMHRLVSSVGYVAENENKIRTVALRTEGWIERLMVKSVGERVKKGDLLFEVYAPTLVNAQEEYLQALQSNNGSLVDASSQRLLAMGISQAQIDSISKGRKAQQYTKIYAPQDGAVSELNIREGMFVAPSQPIISLVDLSSVWLVADVFERQAAWIKVGQKAEATLPFMPEKLWTGQVEYIYPSLDAKTRSLKVRLRFDNISEMLKPNMYADVKIYSSPKPNVLAIPREALIRTGKDQRVIVSLGDGKFRPKSVRVGMETDDYIEVIAGLQEGEQVVTSSQFLIDSESSIKAAMMRMNAE